MSYLQLTKQERKNIEQMLKTGNSLYQMSKALERSPSTIAREIKRNRTQTSKRNAFNKKFADNNCVHASICMKYRLCLDCDGPYNACRQCMRCNAVCDDYKAQFCPRRDSAPWCCNGCEKRRRCSLVKYDYRANEAQEYAQEKLVHSRSGLAVKDHTLDYINHLFSPLLKKGQSVHHIFMNHQEEIPCSEKTIYAYLHAGLLDADLFDLPRTLQRKPSRKRPEHKVDRQCYLGRTYKDYVQWLDNNPGVIPVEMDTVEGTKASNQVLLTLKWVQSGFIMAYLLKRQTASEVNAIFLQLQEQLGKETYKQLFPILLTDRGSEFTNPKGIENYKDEQWTHVFFCDPQKPQQKPHVENEHSLLRRKLPKGTDFDALTQEDIQVMLSHVNSYKRESKQQKSPIEIFRYTYGQEILNLFQVHEKDADEVDLTVYKKDK